MNRRIWIFGLAAAAVTLLLGTFGWVTGLALELEARERLARQATARNEALRLGLWRLDSLVGSLLAWENSQAPFDLWSDEGISAPADEEVEELVEEAVQARFELEAPESGTGVWLLASPEDAIDFGPLGEDLVRMAPELSEEPPAAAAAGGAGGSASPPVSVESLRNTSEFERRSSNFLQQQMVFLPSEEVAEAAVESILEPRWVGGELVLIRRIRDFRGLSLQGIWLDWAALEQRLRAEVADLLPGARFEPLSPSGDPAEGLALLPVRLVPGAPGKLPDAGWTPVEIALLVAWGVLLSALAGGVALILGAMRLARRRADFVSAVTHELRTPLTTFELYTEMLRDGMVQAEERPRYLETLRSEAGRLRHLVDNVLAYSRLERRALDPARRNLPVAELIEEMLPALEERAGRAGLTLSVAVDEAVGRTLLRTEPKAVERILVNLVDNACKYARGSKPAEIRLRVAQEGRRLVLRVRDFGPGIPRRDHRKVFRPFHRSAAEAAGREPGVGLGLALARRLAKSLGGRLTLAEPAEGHGLAFELRIPR